jgi:hypothetical protein
MSDYDGVTDECGSFGCQGDDYEKRIATLEAENAELKADVTRKHEEAWAWMRCWIESDAENAELRKKVSDAESYWRNSPDWHDLSSSEVWAAMHERAAREASE